MLVIRAAAADDAPLLKVLIDEFAAFERLSAAITEESLRQDGFGTDPQFRVFIAEWDGFPAGYALFFDCYSSFQGRCIFLEDLYVRDEFRGKKIGKALIARVAAAARGRNCFGVMFNVLDWNRPAIDFYKELGAEFWNDWKTVCLQGRALQSLAETVR